MFAAGHLGELTWQIPVELVDAVLVDTNATERRLRMLPSRVRVYFVLALCLFPRGGVRDGVGEAAAAIPDRIRVSVKAFSGSTPPRRCRAPLRALFEVLAGPVAVPSTPGVRFGRYRAPSRSTGACRSRCPTATVTGSGWAS